MKEFNWSEFKDTNNIIAVHCKTEEEAKDFCKQMHEHGMRWLDRDSYLDCIAFRKYKDATCYSNAGGHSRYRFYEENGFTILEWSDYMQTEFTKADLKDGMVVELRNKQRYIKLGERLLNFDTWMCLNNYADNLCDVDTDKEFDIVKVFKVNTKRVTDLKIVLRDEYLEPVWKRDEVKRMTTEEMRQKLEELTGKKIEVESNRRVGQWFLLDECSNSGVYCSICGKKVYKEDYANQKIKSKFCPNCGAIMEC